MEHANWFCNCRLLRKSGCSMGPQWLRSNAHFPNTLYLLPSDVVAWEPDFLYSLMGFLLYYTSPAYRFTLYLAVCCSHTASPLVPATDSVSIVVRSLRTISPFHALASVCLLAASLVDCSLATFSALSPNCDLCNIQPAMLCWRELLTIQPTKYLLCFVYLDLWITLSQQGSNFRRCPGTL